MRAKHIIVDFKGFFEGAKTFDPHSEPPMGDLEF